MTDIRIKSILASFQNSFFSPFVTVVLGKPVFSIQTQAVKLHKHFFHFKHSLRLNKKSILGEYLRSLNQVRGTIYTSNE